jgi:hypothetical protein
MIWLIRHPDNSARMRLHNLTVNLVSRAIYLDEGRAPALYAILMMVPGFVSPKEVTPDSLKAYEALYEFYAARQEPEAMLETLDHLETLAAAHHTGASLDEYLEVFQGEGGVSAPVDEGEETVSVVLNSPVPGMRNFDTRSREAILSSIYQRRAILLRRQGRYVEANVAAGKFLAYRSQDLKGAIEELGNLVTRNRYGEAILRLGRSLRLDYYQPEALLLWAKLLKDNAARQQMQVKTIERVPQVLLRLLLHHPQLNNDELTEAESLLQGVDRSSTTDRYNVALIRGLIAVQRGNSSQAAEVLEPLTKLSADDAISWPQSHLACYYYGVIQQGSARQAQAKAAWLAAIALSPNHVPSLQALLKMAKADPVLWGDTVPTVVELEERLQSLVPAVPVPISFNGPFTLLGISPGTRVFKREFRGQGVTVTQDESVAQLVLLWRAEESSDQTTKMVLRMHDKHGGVISTTGKDMRQAVSLALGKRSQTRAFRAGEVFAVSLDISGDSNTIKALSLVLSYRDSTLRADVGYGWADFPLDLAALMGQAAPSPAATTDVPDPSPEAAPEKDKISAPAPESTTPVERPAVPPGPAPEAPSIAPPSGI